MNEILILSHFRLSERINKFPKDWTKEKTVALFLALILSLIVFNILIGLSNLVALGILICVSILVFCLAYVRVYLEFKNISYFIFLNIIKLYKTNISDITSLMQECSSKNTISCASKSSCSKNKKTFILKGLSQGRITLYHPNKVLNTKTKETLKNWYCEHARSYFDIITCNFEYFFQLLQGKKEITEIQKIELDENLSSNEIFEMITVLKQITGIHKNKLNNLFQFYNKREKKISDLKWDSIKSSNSQLFIY